MPEFLLKNAMLALVGFIFSTTSGGLIIYKFAEYSDIIGICIGCLLLIQALLMLLESVLQAMSMTKKVKVVKEES